MAYIYGDIPFFECLVRREYTRNLEDGQGEYLPAVAHAIQCKRGRSLMFQCIFTDKHAGCAFLLPIEALCWKPCARPFDLTYVQPWDAFSDTFTVVEASFVARGAVQVLPARQRAQYRFTLDWSGSDLADHFEQHKHLHICFLESGLIGAFPNNRLIWEDPAFWTATKEMPDFKSLAGEYRAEGNQRLMRVPPVKPIEQPVLVGTADEAKGQPSPGMLQAAE